MEFDQGQGDDESDPLATIPADGRVPADRLGDVDWLQRELDRTRPISDQFEIAPERLGQGLRSLQDRHLLGFLGPYHVLVLVVVAGLFAGYGTGTSSAFGFLAAVGLSLLFCVFWVLPMASLLSDEEADQEDARRLRKYRSRLRSARDRARGLGPGA